MEQDIHKLGEWLEKICQEGIALEGALRKTIEENNKVKERPDKRAKAS